MESENFHIQKKGKPPLLSFAIISCGAIGLLSVMLWASFKTEIEDRNNLGILYARMTEGTITRTLESVNNSLFPLVQHIQNRLPQWLTRDDIAHQVSNIIRFAPHIRQIVIIRNGVTLHDTNPRSSDDIDLSQLSLPVNGNQNLPGTLHIGNPVDGRFLPVIGEEQKKSKRQIIPLFLDFENHHSKDKYQILVALNASYLSNLFKSLDLHQEDSYRLVRFDGFALINANRRIMFETEIDQTMKKVMLSGGDETIRTFSRGFIPRAEAAIRLSSKFPFAVIITTNHQASSSAWFEKNRTLIIALIATTLVVLISAYFLFQDYHRTRRLRREVDILSAAIHQSPLSVLITDINGLIQYANPAFTDVYGYKKEDYIGVTPSILKSGHTDDEVYDALWQTISSGKPWQGEFLNRTKAGGMVPTYSAISPVYDEDYRNSHIIGILSDITEQKELQESALKASEQARNASKAKSNFLATMSHELRTPMTGIRGIIDLLKNDKTLHPNTKELLADLDYSSNALLMLLNDILDLSKIEAGKLDVDLSPNNPVKLTQHTVHLFKEQAESKNISLVCTTACEQDIWARTDGLRLRQILSNLVSNAIKFTEKGRVEVRLEITKKFDNKALIEIAVSDSGIGMTPAQLKTVFDPFTQADSTTTRKFGGTGLGLSITKQLCTLLGGQLTAHSEYGKGSTFRIKLPVDLTSSRDDKTEETIQLPSLDVLVAEDNLINQKVVATMLRQKGHKVELANNGIEAIEKAAIRTFDLILMDMQMPEMDGATATQNIRKNSEFNKDTLIFAFTADAFNEHHDTYLKVGVDDIVTKPVRWDILEQKIANKLKTEQ